MSLSVSSEYRGHTDIRVLCFVWIPASQAGLQSVGAFPSFLFLPGCYALKIYRAPERHQNPISCLVWLLNQETTQPGPVTPCRSGPEWLIIPDPAFSQSASLIRYLTVSSCSRASLLPLCYRLSASQQEGLDHAGRVSITAEASRSRREDLIHRDSRALLVLRKPHPISLGLSGGESVSASTELGEAAPLQKQESQLPHALLQPAPPTQRTPCWGDIWARGSQGFSDWKLDTPGLPGTSWSPHPAS